MFQRSTPDIPVEGIVFQQIHTFILGSIWVTELIIEITNIALLIHNWAFKLILKLVYWYIFLFTQTEKSNKNLSINIYFMYLISFYLLVTETKKTQKV